MRPISTNSTRSGVNEIQGRKERKLHLANKVHTVVFNLNKHLKKNQGNIPVSICTVCVLLKLSRKKIYNHLMLIQY